MPIGQKASTTHPAYNRWLPSYTIIDDCLQGEQRVKSKADTYLFPKNPDDDTTLSALQYNRYKQRAIFTGYTSRVATALAGLAFLQEPEIQLPPQLNRFGFEENVTGNGLSLLQFAKELVFQVLCFGRGAIWVDAPERPEGQLTIAEEEALGFRPYFVFNGAMDIVNWFADRHELQLVSLKHVVESLDGFNVSEVNRYRVLTLSDRVYAVEVWEENGNEAISSSVPLMYNGEPFSSIPISIVGAQNNDLKPDTPPIYPVASLNLGVYRNTADTETVAFNSSQLQYWLSGMDNTQLAAMEKAGQKLIGGSSNVWMLGPEGRAGVIQPAADVMSFELQKDKIEQIQLLSVQLASTGVARTASEVWNESIVRNSVLVNVMNNVSQAVENALKDACLFVGADPDSVRFELKSDLQEIADEAETVVQDAMNASENNNENTGEEE